MEIVQLFPTRAKSARAWLKHAHSFDRRVALAGTNSQAAIRGLLVNCAAAGFRMKMAVKVSAKLIFTKRLV